MRVTTREGRTRCLHLQEAHGAEWDRSKRRKDCKGYCQAGKRVAASGSRKGCAWTACGGARHMQAACAEASTLMVRRSWCAWSRSDSTGNVPIASLKCRAFGQLACASPCAATAAGPRPDGPGGAGRARRPDEGHAAHPGGRHTQPGGGCPWRWREASSMWELEGWANRGRVGSPRACTDSGKRMDAGLLKYFCDV